MDWLRFVLADATGNGVPRAKPRSLVATLLGMTILAWGPVGRAGYRSAAYLEDFFEPVLADGVDNLLVLGLEQLVHLLVGEAGLADAIGIGNGLLADAAALDEDLGLQQLVVAAGLALHVVDRVLVANVGVEAEDHWAVASGQLPGTPNPSAGPPRF